MASVIRAFMSRDRAAAGGVAVFAGWLAYQTSLQVNFTSLAAAEPLWLITAAGVVSWGASKSMTTSIEPRAALALGWATALCALVIALNIARVYAADALLLTSVRAAQEGRVDRSLAAIADARRLAPEREQYAIVAGDLQSIAAARSSDRASWEAAIQSYEGAARLGASDPSMFRRLAVAYENLGRVQDAGKANAYAATLSPFDPRSRDIRPPR
jgi:hypothetical protein